MSKPEFPQGEAAILSAMRAFLLALLPAGCLARPAQQNRAAPPLTANHADPLNATTRPPGWVQITMIGPERLTANFSAYSADCTRRTVQHVSKFEVQLDCFGETAQEWAASICNAFRDPEFYTAFFPAGIRPLYADDPRQIAFTSDASQFEKRWMIRAFLQYEPKLVLPASGVTSVTVTPAIIEAIE